MADPRMMELDDEQVANQDDRREAEDREEEEDRESDDEEHSDDDDDDEEATPWTHGIVSQAQKIENLRAEVRKLLREHKKNTDAARIQLDPSSTFQSWDDGPPNHYYQRYRKRAQVLPALKSENVPKCMTWSYEYDKGHVFFDYNLLRDRDIFLARLELDDFESTFVDKPYEVPSFYRNDKEIMMKVVAKNSEALQFASTKLKDDQEVVLAAIQNGNHMAPLAIAHASKKLRRMKKIVRVALNQDYGIRCVKFIDPKLQNDKNLILSSIRHSSEECNRQYEVLSELPGSLREDDQIVIAALKKRGSNLRYVTCPDLLHDFDVALTACEQDGAALAFVPEGETRQELLTPEYLRMIVANGGYGALDDETAALVVWDKEMLLAAAQNPYCDIDNLAQIYAEDRSLFSELMQINCNLYKTLPGEQQGNESVARVCLASESLTVEIAVSILEKSPSLLSDFETMGSMAKRGFSRVIERASKNVRDDKQIMMTACQVKGSSFTVASDRLQKDPDVLSAALRSGSHNVVFTVATSTFQNDSSRALAVAAIQAYGGSEHKRLREHLSNAVFFDRKVLLAWFERKDWPKMSFIDSGFIRRGNYLDDHEFMYQVAAYRGSLSNLGCEELLGNRQFVKACLAVEGRVLGELRDGHRRGYWHRENPNIPLRWDFELMLIAMAQSRMALYDFYHKGRTFKKLTAFGQKIRSQLDLYTKFLYTFLAGISNHNQNRVPPNLRCHLPMLDSGGGTDVKRIIAQFAGIPVGEELQTLQKAKKNLSFWGY